MDRLRSPGGCPWDARQTHASLVEYLVEEAYEVVEAIEAEDREAIKEELGDLLLQVVFHARIAAEDPADPWTIDDVADGIVAKLIRRHPHVFAEDGADSIEQVESRWHELKAAEKGRDSVTDGIPASLPALLYAAKLLARSASLDVVVPGRESAAVVLDGVGSDEALGELLLGIVAEARDRGWDAESAVRMAARAHAQRIRDIEQNPPAGRT